MLYYEYIPYTDDYGVVYDALGIGRLNGWPLTDNLNALDVLSKKGFIQIEKKDDFLLLLLCTDFFSGNSFSHPIPPEEIHANILITTALRLCFADQIPQGVTVIGNVDQDTHKLAKNMHRAQKRELEKTENATKVIAKDKRLDELVTLTLTSDDDEVAPPGDSVDATYIARIATLICDGHITGIGSLNITDADRQAIAALSSADYVKMADNIAHVLKNGYPITHPRMYVAMVILRYVRQRPNPAEAKRPGSLAQYGRFMRSDYDLAALEQALLQQQGGGNGV